MIDPILIPLYISIAVLLIKGAYDSFNQIKKSKCLGNNVIEIEREREEPDNTN